MSAGRFLCQHVLIWTESLSCRKSSVGVSTTWAFALLLAARLVSACLNIVHDCDEVYNYWEPLHFLLYGYGMQTWEYRCVYSNLDDCAILCLS